MSEPPFARFSNGERIKTTTTTTTKEAQHLYMGVYAVRSKRMEKGCTTVAQTHTQIMMECFRGNERKIGLKGVKRVQFKTQRIKQEKEEEEKKKNIIEMVLFSWLGAIKTK